MTDTTFECELSMAFTEYLPNNALAAVADECLQEVGAPKWDDADYRMAKEFLNTYPATTLENIKSQIIETYGEDRLEEILRKAAGFRDSTRYNPDKIIVHDFSADVHDGQKIAIVGPTGAGKTTMVKLLMRFYDVNKGAIKVDGHDVRNFNRSELHEMFGMVLQDTWLFSGTIMETSVCD